MERGNKRGIGWLAELAYVLLMPIAISLVLGWREVPALLDGFWSQEAAGWAQVLGAVVAIFGSAHLAARHHDRLARETARDQLIGYRNLAHIAARYIDFVHANIEPGIMEEKYKKDFEVCKSAIDAIPFVQIRTPSLIYSYVNLVHHFDRFRKNFEDPWPQEIENQTTRQRRMTESLEEVRREMRTLDQVAIELGAIKKEGGIFYSPSELGGRTDRQAQVRSIDY
jgi:hypothetical protein